MSINYLIEVNGLDEWELGNPLSATAYKVMHKLLFLANRRRFPEQMRVSNAALCSMVGCSENSLIAAREQLIQRGLIEYKGRKKQTPLYTLLYFSNRPDYNRNICGINDGINRGINRGINGGIDGGIDGGRDITNEPRMDEEEDTDTANPSPEAEAIDRIHLQGHGTPTNPSVGVNARDGGTEFVDVFIRQPVIREVYGRGYDAILKLLQGPYPRDLVAEAVNMTVTRDKRYEQPLVNPVAYTMALLKDWQAQGFETVADMKEARDGFYNYG